jgi:hypothetical protein
MKSFRAASLARLSDRTRLTRRQLGALSEGGGQKKEPREDQHVLGNPAVFNGRQEFGNARGAHQDEEPDPSQQKAHVPQAGHEKGPFGGVPGILLPVAVPDQEKRGQSDPLPRPVKEQEGIGQHQGQHGADEKGEFDEEPRPVGRFGHVPHRIEGHHQRYAGHHQRQIIGEAVEHQPHRHRQIAGGKPDGGKPHLFSPEEQQRQQDAGDGNGAGGRLQPAFEEQDQQGRQQGPEGDRNENRGRHPFSSRYLSTWTVFRFR